MHPFGKKFREAYFNIDKDVTPVNHGSYGLVPIPVQEAFLDHMKRDMAYPDRYIRQEQRQDIDAATAKVAQLVDCSPKNVVFVPNATSGVNTVLRSLPFEKGDKVLIQNTVYGACGNTVKFLKSRYGVEIIVVDLNYPLSDDQVLSKFEEKLNANDIKLCMFDAVTSQPGVKLPFERLVPLCKKYNTLSLVDAAHAIGLLPFSLNELQPDFFVSNLHKWLFTPRGCAMLYVSPSHHGEIQTFPISHSYVDDHSTLTNEKQESLLVDKFAFTGSTSFASYISAIDAIEFRKTTCGGEQKILDYCHQLALEAATVVSANWDNATVLDNEEHTLITAMVNVKVPLSKYVDGPLEESKVLKVKDYVEEKLIQEFKTFAPMCFHNGSLWCRFSCEVYNDISDYDYASNAILKCLDQFFKPSL